MNVLVLAPSYRPDPEFTVYFWRATGLRICIRVPGGARSLRGLPDKARGRNCAGMAAVSGFGSGPSKWRKSEAARTAPSWVKLKQNDELEMKGI